MNRHSKKDIDNLKRRLDKLKDQEQSIKNKYSDNFKEWQILCNKINKLKNKYNGMIHEYNYDHGGVYNSAIII